MLKYIENPVFEKQMSEMQTNEIIFLNKDFAILIIHLGDNIEISKQPKSFLQNLTERFQDLKTKIIPRNLIY